jgi:hypothetical protein
MIVHNDDTSYYNFNYKYKYKKMGGLAISPLGRSSST